MTAESAGLQSNSVSILDQGWFWSPDSISANPGYRDKQEKSGTTSHT